MVSLVFRGLAEIASLATFVTMIGLWAALVGGL
jgi:hypothetical protein